MTQPTHPELALLLHLAALREQILISTMTITVDPTDGWVRMSTRAKPELATDDARSYAAALELTSVEYVETEQGDEPVIASIQGRLNGMRVHIHCSPEPIDWHLPEDVAA